MTFEKIGKGEALIWLSGAVGIESVMALLAVIFSLSYVIPEIAFNPGRVFYPALFILTLVFSYVIYRVGVAGEKPRKVVSLWFSGATGAIAIGQLMLAVMGWGFAAPEIQFSFSAAADPISFGVTWLVLIVISGALWMHAKKDGAISRHFPSFAKPASRKAARKRRR